MGKKFTRVFFATDIHGSETCWKKFVNAADFYKVDVLVLGGDVTGKVVVPIVDHGDGRYTTRIMGYNREANSEQEILALRKEIGDLGYYPHILTGQELDEIKAQEKDIDVLFRQLMVDTMKNWLALANERLRGKDVKLFVTGGNDDSQEVIDEICKVEYPNIENPDGEVVYIDGIHEMASLGFSNPTPWETPREVTEEELSEMINKMASKIEDMPNAVFNFHAPPLDSGLDTAVRLDTSVYPPIPVTKAGSPIHEGVGSSAVRDSIDKYQPLCLLTGHIHESRGYQQFGHTHAFNPGSEYGEGVLRGVIVTLADEKLLGYQFVSG
ncbi:MAG: metallophosphoesterase [Promethearchaeota archaeon]